MELYGWLLPAGAEEQMAGYWHHAAPDEPLALLALRHASQRQVSR